MRATEVPVSSATVAQLVQEIGHPGSSVARIAQVVSADQGLAARVLALANSAAYGLARQVTAVDQAVALVGSNMVQTLAVAGAMRLLDGADGLPHARFHALQVACAARALAGRAGLNKSDAFAAGLLHDVGEILLWQRDPAAYAAAHATWPDAEAQLRGERAMFGTDHALAAREQLAGWHLPGAIVDAAADHHRPDVPFRDLSTAVIAAEELLDADVGWTPRVGVFDLEPDDAAVVRLEVSVQVAELTGLLLV
ncbi:MAG TPA: HDOD domain-containing protein [Acidimicrobiales bacterium]|nr:HDOD domain-containing protein [Acidimicrobiales bacterium]